MKVSYVTILILIEKQRLITFQRALTECIADPATNKLNEKHIALYKYWGDCSAGLIISGNVMIDSRYMESPRNVVLEDDKDISNFQFLAKEAQQNGSTFNYFPK